MAGSGVTAGFVIAGKYRVDRMVGEGGMGVVLAAEHLHLRQPVAIKLLHVDADEELVHRFQREARVVAQLRSVHVPRMYDVDWLETGEPYIVMELLDGQDLDQVLAERGPLPQAEAVGLVLQACDALGEAHANGVVHRDLKPANLFVVRGTDGAPCVKVLDFGLAKLRTELETSGPGGSLTRTGSFLGSPAYMPPEQWASAKSTDARSDIWALGAILYELLAGHPPFEGQSFGEMGALVANAEPAKLRTTRPELARELEAVVERCLRKSPAARFQSVPELVAALRPFAPPQARASAASRPSSEGAQSLPASSELGSAPTVLSDAQPALPAAFQPTMLAAAQAPWPSAQPGVPAAAPAMVAVPPAAGQATRRSRLALWLGLGVALIGVVALVIGLVLLPRATRSAGAGPAESPRHKRGHPEEPGTISPGPTFEHRPLPSDPQHDKKGPAGRTADIALSGWLADVPGAVKKLEQVAGGKVVAVRLTVVAGGATLEAFDRGPPATVNTYYLELGAVRGPYGTPAATGADREAFRLDGVDLNQLDGIFADAVKRAPRQERRISSLSLTFGMGTDAPVWLVCVGADANCRSVQYDTHGRLLRVMGEP